ncbi:MAG: protoporphyrinogen oxidase [Gemmatimonadaceae bacterium]
MSSRVVVIGGGISGLAAAWATRAAATRRGEAVEILVLERDTAVGGKARSLRGDGWLVEGGPSGFLDGRPALDQLIEAAGLTGDVVPAGLAAKHRYIFRAGQLRRVAPSPVGLVREGLLSVGGMFRLLAEPFVPRRRGDEDETVWAFAARRLGVQAADRLVSPMALGIFAGDARRLSLGSAFPRMAALEANYGSLIRGMIAKRGRTSSGTLKSFRHGMQSLPTALAERGGFQVRCNAEVTALVRDHEQWQVVVAGDRESIPVDAVICAGEPWATANLLRSLDADAATALDAIPCPAITVVALGYRAADATQIPSGFGVLISRKEGIRMLGNLWEMSLYPGRGPDGHVLVRAMLGGAVDPEAGALAEADALALVKDEVSRLYHISSPPVFERVVRVPRAIPQYELGHRERVATVERALTRLPGLYATGYGLRGVAFADAATDGVRTGEQAAADLSARHDGASSGSLRTQNAEALR